MSMDNNYNNNQNSNSFYSFNNGMNQYGNGMQQQEDTSGQGGYAQQGLYQNQGQIQAQGQIQDQGQVQGQGQTQSQGQVQNQGQNPGPMVYGSTSQQVPEKKEQKRREKKSGGFGIKLARCAALALVFGLVSGVVIEGVHFASRGIFGDDDVQTDDSSGNVLTQIDSDDRLEATATSSTYVAVDVSDIVEEVMPAMVAVTNVSEREYMSFWGVQSYETPSLGTGIIVGEDKENLYIVTNNHVVSGAKSLTVTFDDDATVSAEVRGTDPYTDLAVIMIDLDSIEESTMESIKIATLGDSDILRVGQASIAIGNALGYGQSVTTGCISALNREVTVADSESSTNYTAELIQTDAAINPGNSGGALLNATGEVIGINSVKYADTDVEGIGYAIPISTAMPIIEELIATGKVDRSNSAYLGIVGVDVTKDVAETYGMPTGVFIAQVAEGSAAEQAGIRHRDIITTFDGYNVTSMEELSKRLQNYKAGETVEVIVQRASLDGYEELTLEVTLGSKN